MIPSPPASRFVSIDGLRLHYLDFGGEGPPAVLHHGTGFHAWLWTPIAQALSRRYQVIALDARGHGDSDTPDSGYSWEGFIADLVRFVDALGLAGGLGVGHSLGGTTMAGAVAERPDLFSAVVLLDPILFRRDLHTLSEVERPMSVMARKRRERWDSREDAFESYRGRGGFAKWPDDMLRLYVDHAFAPDDGGVRLKCPPHVEAQVFGMSLEFDCWGTIDRVAVPALVVRGAESEALNGNDGEEVLRRLRRGTLRTIPAATHTFPMEKPDEVASAILDFTDATAPIVARGLGHLREPNRRG
jgi:pimeloyl-ACP methyl ester carboxylesterase